MDASQVIKLKLARMGSYTHPYKTVDASTHTWRKQLQTPHVVPKTPLCSGELYDPASVASCVTCGQGATTALTTNSTAAQVHNMYHGQMGSATRMYSSEAITLQKASRAMCASSSQPPSAIIVPSQYCESNTAEGPNVNPYQPTYATQMIPPCSMCYKGFETNDLERCQCDKS